MVSCGIECNTVCNARIGCLLFCEVSNINVGVVTDFHGRQRQFINPFKHPFIDDLHLTK